MTDKAETIHDANAAFAAGNFQKTVLICGRILELQPQDYWASLTLGNAHERLGNRSEAARAWRQATECSVDYKIGAYHYLLRQEFSDQDFSNVDLLDDALSLALESNQKRWHYAPLLFLSGVRYIAAGDFPAADRNIEAAYKFYRDLDEGSLLFGWIIERLESLSDIALYPQLVYLVRSARARRTPVSYQSALNALQSHRTVFEIGAMDGVKYDPLNEIIKARRWSAVLVEPTLDMYSQLCANYAGYENVQCIRAAITENSGELIMNRLRPEALDSPDIADWGRMVSSASMHLLKFYEGQTMQEAVPAMTFDELTDLAGLSPIDVLQIDTEGHDWTIFSQVNLDRWKIKVIHIELRWLDAIERLQVFDKLDEWGYTVGFDGHDVTAVSHQDQS